MKFIFEIDLRFFFFFLNAYLAFIYVKIVKISFYVSDKTTDATYFELVGIKLRIIYHDFSRLCVFFVQ